MCYVTFVTNILGNICNGNILVVKFKPLNIWNCTEYVYTCLYGALIEQIQSRRVLSNPHGGVISRPVLHSGGLTHCDYLLILCNLLERCRFLKNQIFIIYEFIKSRFFQHWKCFRSSSIASYVYWPELKSRIIQSRLYSSNRKYIRWR